MIFQGDESVAADFPMKSPEESKNLTSSTQRKPDHDPQMRAGPKTETNLGAQEQIDQGTNCLTASVLFNHCILSLGVVERPFLSKGEKKIEYEYYRMVSQTRHP